MKLYLNATKTDFWDHDKRKSNRCSPRESAKILLAKSSLEFSKFFIEFDVYCIYDDDIHVYVEYTKIGFVLIVAQILELADHPSLTDYDYVKKVVDNLGLNKKYAKLGYPSASTNFLVFNNCMYDIQHKCTREFDKQELIFSYLPFEYNGNTSMPVFLGYLKDFCAGYTDRVEFVRCFLFIVIHGPGPLQLFFHFYGAGGSGKSTLANIAQCLAGKKSCITTSLKKISQDQFEAINLANRKLIIISENEKWSEDTSVLKNISGGDTLAGRKKHVQGSFEVIISGVLAIFNNSKFNTRDDTGAIERRIKPFRADAKIKEKKDLLRYSIRDGWVGDLVEEIPAILNWINDRDKKDVYTFMGDITKSVPSFSSEYEQNKVTFNPVLSWIQDEIVPGKGLYLGMKSKSTVRDDIDAKQRRTLYPAYQRWCDRQGFKPISRMKFASSIEMYLDQLGIKATLKRKGAGQFLTNIDLHEKVFLLDYQAGSPMWYEGREVITDNGSPGYVQNTDSFHPAIGGNLREKYIDKLKTSPLKVALNKVCVENMTDSIIPELLNTFSSATLLKDKTYLDSVNKQITDGVHNIREHGGIPYKWKGCGNSPRLIPEKYGKSINFTKRVVRDKSYQIMGKEANKLGYTIVDVDITSCYLGVLLGLRAAELNTIVLMVETSNIWKEIEKQFTQVGKGHMYNKAAVKVCVYASYFLGGSKAMRVGIHENIRKEAGLVPKDYKNSSYYEDSDKIADDVITVMRTSEIIAQLKDTSITLHKAYVGGIITGPTGDSWIVTEHNWRNVYPNYLISFEIALLGKSTLNVIEKYPSVEIIGHYHDGCVLIIPTDEYDSIIKYHQDQIAKVGNDLGLQYTQKLEVKTRY